MLNRPNIICIVSDTLRTDYLGCYGNKLIHTPNLDAFASESIVFDNAHPESLPTIPYRRGLHTGRRAYPFRDYKPVSWDNVYLPGWQPMENEKDCIAENLVSAGYYTGFASDVPHYFVPGMNFTRGALQWEYIRGQAEDKWHSPAIATDKELIKYGDPEQIKKQFPNGRSLRHVANYSQIRSEEETSTAKVFRWGMDFIEDNRHAKPFYLYMDCFAPHESWEAPEPYLEMYADPNYKGITHLSTVYGPGKSVYTPEELEHIKAHYCGLVSLVDNWFGLFMAKLKRLGLFKNSLIIFTSDHGTNFTDNPEGVIGKPHYSLFPGVMRIPLMVRLPDGIDAGKRFGNLVYNVDMTATMYKHAGLGDINIDGRSLCDIICGKCEQRGYLTCRYGDTVWYRDREYWVIMTIDGKPISVFYLPTDPDCRENILNDANDALERAWEMILQDANGELPAYNMKDMTDAIGRRR